MSVEKNQPHHTVGAYDAKTKLGQLLDRVENGEAIVITRHGEPVARLVPFGESIDHKRVQRAVDGILALQKTHSLGGITIEELINEGRTL